MFQFLNAVIELTGRGTGGLLLLPFVTMAVLHSAVALGRSRQWYLLPVLFGLTALAGFLLNPLADASTLQDLKSRLTNYETLTALCIVQFLLVGISIWLGSKIDGSGDSDRAGLWLGIVSAVPPPVLVIAMLLIEQVALSTSSDARPEAVGRGVGLSIAAMLTAPALVALCIPPRWLAAPHNLFSMAMILVCMFVPLLQDPLPQSLTLVDWESLKLFACLLPALIILIAGGWWISDRAMANETSAEAWLN
jgi:hypothetical protein